MTIIFTPNISVYFSKMFLIIICYFYSMIYYFCVCYFFHYHFEEAKYTYFKLFFLIFRQIDDNYNLVGSILKAL